MTLKRLQKNMTKNLDLMKVSPTNLQKHIQKNIIKILMTNEI